MSSIKSMRRCASTTVRTAAAAVALAVGVALPAAPALAAPTASGSQFDTTADLMAASNLSGTVYTSGDETADDGAGMRFTVTDTLPDGIEGNIAVPLADGTWAVPQGLPTAPTRASNSTQVEDLISRGESFYDAGTTLVWDSSRPTPLTGTVVHSATTAPYGVTCSTFVSMVLLGWDYTHTTYTADTNTQVGYAVDFGVDPSTSKIWRANNLASWFYAHGDLWMETNDNYERGDILFFSAQNPEGRIDEVRSGEEATYFGNVYHAAIYLGDGLLLHSTGTGTGVNITTLNPLLKEDLSFVARPELTATTVNNSQPAPAGTGSAGAPASAGETTGASGDDANPGISGDASGAQQAQTGQQRTGTTSSYSAWFERHYPGHYATATATHATATAKYRSWVFYG